MAISSPTPVTKPTRPARNQDPRGRRGGHGLSLGRWGGIPVSANWTTLFLLALFAETLAVGVLPSARPGLAGAVYWLAGVATAVVFLATLLAHELAHALTAKRYGVGVRGITLWLLGGVTELDDDASRPRTDGLIAAAGPAASFVLGGLSVLGAWWVGSATLVGSALAWLAAVNILLAVFNLLPGAPLDGGRVLRAVLWARSGDRGRAEELSARAGRVLGYVLIGLGLFEVSGGTSAGLWLVLVGWFVIGGANAERQQSAVTGLKGIRAEQAMTLAPIAVADWWTVDQFFARVDPEQFGTGPFPLVDFGGQATGALTRPELERVPAERRDETRLRDIVAGRRVPPLLVPPSAQLASIVAVLRSHAGLAVVVDDAQHPIGIITAADLNRVRG